MRILRRYFDLGFCVFYMGTIRKKWPFSLSTGINNVTIIIIMYTGAIFTVSARLKWSNYKSSAIQHGEKAPIVSSMCFEICSKRPHSEVVWVTRNHINLVVRTCVWPGAHMKGCLLILHNWNDVRFHWHTEWEREIWTQVVTPEDIQTRWRQIHEKLTTRNTY